MQRLLDRSLRGAIVRAIGQPEESVDTPLVAYARTKLGGLQGMPFGWDGGEAPPVTEMAARRLLRILAYVSHEDTVFPALTPDFEGGVVAEWRAGRQHLVLEVDADGVAFVTAVNEAGETEISADLNFDQELYRRLRSFDEMLLRMSKRVEMINPNWRSLFA
ncbi:hypothetical protein [Streptomyces tritici]|uniref:hypothetical protein n=1 Tax=Streptomyces tritici TaxID=2054410 RepID=UPI003AF18D1C